SPKLVADVTKESGYLECDPATRSELVVGIWQRERYGYRGRLVGVLNLESFSLNGFDEQDLAAVQQLVQMAANESLLIRRDVDFSEIISHLAKPAPNLTA